ncbi:MAG: glycosyltransferase [Clostridia bacterium]|nr:glycosyltransferase [Clostridia bacterium]NCC44158.1 glycosyltransferase [Clostridia bacterium]
MNKKTVDVIIPAYKPGEEWKKLIKGIENQTYPVQCIRVMNTGKENWRSSYEIRPDKMEIHHVTREEFDHGGTRDKAARMSKSDYILFMTQDAVPENDRMIEKLVEAIEKEDDIRAAYARQLPARGCRLAEQYTRQFNYPGKSRVKRMSDLPELGIKTYFCSNVCAMYDRETFLLLGGFVKKTIFNEDMIFAGNLIQKGYAVAYAADARVIHSHNYTAMQQFHRNFDLAVSQADHPEIFANVKSEGEGIRLVKKTAGWLCRQGKPWLVISLAWNSGWRYLGYLLGKRYRHLPGWLIRFATMNDKYWAE